MTRREAPSGDAILLRTSAELAAFLLESPPTQIFFALW